MTNIRLTCAVVIASLLCGAAAAGTWTIQAPEKTFVFHGKPIDPRCVDKLPGWEKDSPQSLDLAACVREMHGKSIVTKNSHGFEAEDPVEGGIRPTDFNSYDIIGRNGARFVVMTMWSGGGTGIISTLMILRKADSRLSVEKVLQSGDRCNGGVDHPLLQGRLLHWSVNFTPYDLVDLGGIKSVLAYKDLETSALSCVATQNWEYDLDSGALRFVSVTLITSYGPDNRSGLIQNRAGWTEQYAYQACFNAFYNSYITGHRTELSPAETKAFAEGFAQSCLKKKP